MARRRARGVLSLRLLASAPMRRAAIAVLLLFSTAACGSRPRPGEEGAPRAVVLSLAEQDELSAKVARALNGHGYEVVRRSTTIRRERSSASVYGVRVYPERPGEVERILRDEAGLTIEVLPFQQHATGGNAVVVWLGSDASPR
jgi:hypothetical protein